MPPAREGLFTWLLLKSPDGWRIRAAHNTNIGSPKPA
jgi:hypothetical protein